MENKFFLNLSFLKRQLMQANFYNIQFKGKYLMSISAKLQFPLSLIMQSLREISPTVAHTKV